MSVSQNKSMAKLSQATSEFWENLSWSDISDKFGNKTTQRGRSYAESGHVQNLWATEDGTNYWPLFLVPMNTKRLFHLKASRKDSCSWHRPAPALLGTGANMALPRLPFISTGLPNNKQFPFVRN
jgi:hypothetical protein